MIANKKLPETVMPDDTLSKNYWIGRFIPELRKSSFADDRSANSVDSASDTISFSVPAELVRSLMKVCNGSDVHLHIMLMSCLQILLHKYTGQESIVTGTPIYSHPDEYVNYVNTTLPLKCEVHKGITCRELLIQVKQVVSEAVAHQNFPRETLLYHLKKLSIIHAEEDQLFDIALVLENIQNCRYLENLRLGLVFRFRRTDMGLEADIEYSAARYHAATIKRMARHFTHALSQMQGNINGAVSDISLISPAEADQLERFSQGKPTDESSFDIISLFREQVIRSPGKSAVVYEGCELTFRELDALSNQMANALCNNFGICKGDIVGVGVGRSEKTIAVLLAILKCGAAYLPVDRSFPPDRIRFILRDSNARLMITDFDNYDDDHIPVLRADVFQQLADACGNNPPPVGLHASDVMYVIYTSGTTGNPKGVMVSHYSLVNYLLWLKDAYDLNESDGALLFSSIAFDLSYTSLWSFVHGVTLYILRDSIYLEPEDLIACLIRAPVTFLKLTPSHFSIICNDPAFEEHVKKYSLRLIFLGGEPINTAHLQQYFRYQKAVTFVNHYGPTETTVGTIAISIIYADMHDFAERPVIGTPINNADVYIVDESLRCVPVNVYGQIAIAGRGVAAGYLNREQLTREKFVKDPFRKDRMMYLTGDIGRWTEAGAVEFKGRIDDQIKIRGYRVETDEIKNKLLLYGQIKDVVILVNTDAGGNNYLAAFYVADEKPDVPAVRNFLAEYLPDYMVPSSFIHIDEIPVTAHGKVNRKALLALKEEEGDQTAYVAPRDAVEAGLVDICSNILSKTAISIKQNFFEIGGQSLKATRLLYRINEVFKVNITLRNIFENPVLEKLADIIRRSVTHDISAIDAAPPADHYELSHAQKRLWILSQFENASVAYNRPASYVLEGDLNKKAFSETIISLIRRHESLRTVFIEVNGEPRQKILSFEELGFELSEEDYSEHAHSDSLIKQISQAEAYAPFDLARGPLVRVRLLKLSENRHLILFTLHHTISDGWSMEVILQELSLLYNAYSQHQPNPLAPLRIQYKDFAVWQNRRIRNESELAEHRKYWLDQMAGPLPVLELPADFPYEPLRSFTGGLIHFTLEKDVLEKLHELSNRYNGTLFMTLIGAIDLLLYKYTTQQDMIIGIPIAGREHQELEGQVGFYANTLPLRTKVHPGSSVLDLLNSVKQTALGAYDHQLYPFDILVDELDLERDLSRPPLFNVMVVLQNTDLQPTSSFALPGVNIVNYETEHVTSKFDLLFNFKEADGQLNGLLEFNARLFKRNRMSRLIGHLKCLIGNMIDNVMAEVQQIKFIDKHEHDVIVNGYNSTATAYGDETVLSLFQHQVRLSPESIGINFRHEQLTYAEIDKRANQLANFLLKKSEKNSRNVVVLMDRSQHSIIAMLGIIKSGLCYAPVNNQLPLSNIMDVLRVVDPMCIIGDRPFMLPDCENIVLTNEWLDLQQDTEPRVKISPDDASYIINTSGSTGIPKCVTQTHRTLNNLIQWQMRDSGIERGLRLLQYSSYGFDVSLQDVFFALCSGGELFIVPEQEKTNFNWLLKYVIANKVQVLSFPYSAFSNFIALNQLPDFEGHSIQHIVSSGEQLIISAQARRLLTLYPTIRLHNHYGPSETHVVTAYTCSGDGSLPEYMPIGKPIANSEIYILRDDLQLVPAGCIGEVYIGGHNLAIGYYGNAGLTAEKFIENPFTPGTRLYKTGDLAKWLDDGSIEYIGRGDNQVKIRGYRIELDEIKNILDNCPEIESSVVVAQRNGKEDNLAAYIISNEDLRISALRSRLKEKLPAYMMPAYFFQVTEFPLTLNGKIDKKKLIEDGGVKLQTDTEFIAPRNETEEQITAIWKTILDVERIGVKDNFFELGGHSLKAVRAVSLINEAFRSNLSLKDLFTEPTIGQLAERVELVSWLRHARTDIISQDNIVI